MKQGRKGKAFTLIELLVVITIIGILAVLVVPTLGKAKRNALKTNCASNLRQIGLAVKMYLLDHGNVFPRIGAADAPKLGLVASYYTPYLNNATEVFRCPAQKNNLAAMPAYGSRLLIPGVTNSTAWVSYEFNYFFATNINDSIRTLTKRDVTDPTLCAYAYDFPYDPTVPADVPYIPHQDGMNVLYCDWHVSWLARADYKPGGNWFWSQGHK